MNGWAQLAGLATPAPPTRRRQHTATSTGFEQIDHELAARTGARLTDPLALPTVYACIRTIAHTVEQLPLRHMVGAEPRPLPEWLRVPERMGDLTQQQLLELWTAELARNGRAFGYFAGDELWWVDPASVSFHLEERPRGRRRQRWRVDGAPVVLAAHDRPGLVHMPLLQTARRIDGVGPLQAARDSLDGYLTTEQYASDVFDAGTWSGGVLESDHDLTPDTATRYQQRWVENRRAGRIPVLGSGLRYKNDVINARDAQWIEARQFNAQEIARLFGLPPRYLGLPSGDSTTYATAVDNDAHYLRTCITGYTSTIGNALSRLVGPGRGADDAGRIDFDYSAWLDALPDTTGQRPTSTERPTP